MERRYAVEPVSRRKTQLDIELVLRGWAKAQMRAKRERAAAGVGLARPLGEFLALQCPGD